MRTLAYAIPALLLSCFNPENAFSQTAFSINDALQQAIKTNPGVGEAAANRRATESELRQQQGTLLPQVRLEARTGPERFNQQVVPAPLGNGDWRNGREVSVVARQLVFDGFSSINEIWRQSARVNAAAARVHERTELLALDAAEAYVDVVRYQRLIVIAEDNVRVHQNLFANVQARFKGGRAGEGDLEQTRERVENAIATLAGFRQSLDEARAKYRRSVGLEPFNLRQPNRLPGLPKSKDESLAVALKFNPTIQAAESDARAAKYAFKSTSGAFVPNVYLEGRAASGTDANGYVGKRDDVSGKVVVSWDIFRGGQDTWKRSEMAERYVEETMKHARLQRDAVESIDKAWAARTLTADRITALNRQITSDRKVIVSYQKEYELGQRSLVDLLNAQNQLFNGLVSLVSTQNVAVFADYQLLAAMGGLIQYVKAPPPADAEPLNEVPFGLIPTKLPPIILHTPVSGPEPLQVPVHAEPVPALNFAANGKAFDERWNSVNDVNGWLANTTKWSVSKAQASATR
ncbi:TolC family outer membrane protein [Bradyrhizobium sp. SYSU BS000235]|uniref:TolC family outer membrane protein n=1 Tax=Bradyrhizobium sp. SYSU BS000235 TaxID=3411332 RepID=UPI003C78AD74